MKSKTILFLLVVAIFNSVGYCQIEYKQLSPFYATERIPTSNSNYSLELEDHGATSFVLEFFKESDFEKLQLGSKNLEIKVHQDHHSPNRKFYSQQIEFNSNDQFTIAIDSGLHAFTIHWYFVGHGSHQSSPVVASRSKCNEPTSIKQSIWRNTPTVLPPPIVSPTETIVNHVIVHHSAGSNTNTNYQDVVRAIYIQHTETNGWDDIGYNYLIAQDGTLFKGRDSQGNFDHDNVRGAHMCNKNNNTMAICLLGNYETVHPSNEMLSVLDALIAWKLNKENISPFGSSTHAIGPNSANLPDAPLSHIAGHRDGCNTGYTACPGQHVYEKLDSIRSNVNEIINGTCTVGLTENTQVPFKIIQSITENEIELFNDILLNDLHIFNLMGNSFYQTTSLKANVIDISSWPSGIYIAKYSKNRKSIATTRFFKP